MQGKNLNHLRIPLTDIQQATNDFSETCFIGSGGFGKVYKAELDHFEDLNLLVAEGTNEGVLPKKRSTVAIKRISNGIDGQGRQGFSVEIETLSKCRHSNIVSLLGFCDEESEMILVYEYVSKGSLDNYLGNAFNLTWARRLQICLDIAYGLNYLHAGTKDKKTIVHRDIKSGNILLDDNWVPKIADFGLSKLHDAGQQHSTIVTYNVAGTQLYLDPEYSITGKLKTKSDIYSLGVVFFEIMCGRLAYDKIYNGKGLPSVVRHSSKKGTLTDLVDPKVKEAGEIVSMRNEGANQYSLDTFLKVACKCLEKRQADRPTMEEIIEELVKALTFQNTLSLEAIKSGTENFSDSKCIGNGRFWKLYEGEVAHANGRTPILAKRWDTTYGQRHTSVLKELDILYRYKHENIIAVVGHLSEKDENIIIYEHVSNRSLDKHLCDPSLTWLKRLKICLDIAKGLEFLHESYVGHIYLVEHRYIKSGSILLDSNWKAKISNFEMSHKENIANKAGHQDDSSSYSLGYVDPEYENKIYTMCFPDLYSLGVILLEMLCGRLAWEEGCKDHSQSLGPLAKRHYFEKGNLDKMIFEAIKEQIAPQSLNIFKKIAIQCLDYGKLNTSQVVSELKEALKFQEDYEIWEPNLLPIDYTEIIRSMSKNSEININPMKTKKAQYDMFTKGVLLEGRKVLFTLGSDGERNEMISSRMFSYKNRTSYRWQSIQESRFKKVAQMFDISKLNIRIDLTTRFLSPGANYGAYIIFKFCDTRKSSSKPIYVNIKYKKGGENLHAYFATRRDDEWMMVELCRFVAHEKDTRFEVLLESFSRCYCGSSPMYIDGIEFRVIDNVTNEEIKEVPQIPEPNSNKDKPFLNKYLNYLLINPFSQPSNAQLLSQNEVSQNQYLMLSAKQILHDPYNPKNFHVESLAKSRLREVIEHFVLQTSANKSRFKEVIELLPQRVFRINCEIQTQMSSQDTEYLCYLVFKLSEKCHGLHCPVKIRDLLEGNNKEVEIVYFRTPNPWNIHENNSLPKARKDGWMEVKVWKFNSKHKLKNGCIPMDLKFTTYEGSMSGLILCGMEFRPM